MTLEAGLTTERRRPATGPPPAHDRQHRAARDERRDALQAQTRARAAVVRRALALADLVAAVITLAGVGYVAGHGLRPGTLALAAVVPVAGKLLRLYDRDQVRLRKSTLEEVPALFQLTGISALMLWFAHGWIAEGVLTRSDVGALWILMFGTIVCGRVAVRYTCARLLSTERCIVVGDPSELDEVSVKVAGRQAEVVGFLPLVDRRRPRPSRPPTHPLDALEDVVVRNRAHRIIIVPGPHAEADVTLECVTRAQAMGTYVSILPRMCEVVGSSVEFDHVDGMTLLGVHPFGLSRSSAFLKRVIDVSGALGGLVAAAPLFAVAAIAIKLDSRGPVFFRQQRMGHGGRPFEMLKFRTMYDGADQARAELAALNGAGDGLFKIADDPRITGVGRILRRFSVDELPQLLNVLRGDMSLVGPRPLVLDEDRNIFGYHRQRLQLTPGMTGPWQVLGTNKRRVPLRDMVTLDYLYAGNWSLWTDVKILLRTVLHVVRGHGL